MSSKLSSDQIFKKAFNEELNAIMTTPAQSTQFSIALDANEGDSVISHKNQISIKTSVTNVDASVVIAPFDVAGLSVIQIHSKTSSTITGAQLLTIQYSPHTEDNIWINTTITLTPSTTSGTVVTSSQLTSLLAVRCRVITAAAITSGTYDLYLVAQ